MIVQCPSCQAKFRIGDEKVTDKGVKIRCTRCSNVFPVRREKGAPAGAAEAAKPAAKPEAAPAPAPVPKMQPPPPPPPAKGAAPPAARAAAAKPAPGPLPPPPPPPPAKPAAKVDLDFDLGFDVPDAKETMSDESGLDLDLGGAPGPAAPAPSTRRSAPPPSKAAPGAEVKRKAAAAMAPPPPPPPPVARDAAAGLEIDLPGDAEEQAPVKKASPAPAAKTAPPPDDFEDLGDLGFTGPLGKKPAEPAPPPPKHDAGPDPFSGLDLDESGPRASAGAEERPPAPDLGLDAGPGEAPPAPPPEAAAPPGNGEAVALARVGVIPREVAEKRAAAAAAAEAARPPPPPPPLKRPPILGSVLNATLVGVAVMGAVWVVQVMQPQRTAAATLVVAELKTGLYATAGGRDVLYVRGRVEGRSGARPGPAQVTVELLDGVGRAIARQEVAAGAMATPEEVFEIRSAADAEALARKLRHAAQARAAPKDGGAPFIAVFYDVPPDPDRLRINAIASLAEAEPPGETPPAPPAGDPAVPTAAAPVAPSHP
jgi:predicted Zn finger-like uncharacterized protein